MRTQRLLLIVITILAVTCQVLIISGCSAADFAQVDRAAGVAGSAAQTAQQALNSPAGQMIPEPIRQGLEIGVGACAAIAGFWLNRRKNKYRDKAASRKHEIAYIRDDLKSHETALKEVVDGCDQFLSKDETGNDDLKNAQNIAQSIATKGLVADYRKAS